ncbi:MoaD family protein [Natronorubrum sp. JWXQ-INN-674]|uniref:MoaD family protein n=1 Tax=Natronorubrum halalkaliphilum TaxID=2691917 RepID=A0A6B0VHH1_9EURY|nr:ubiquitin-like small modifier protein 1 [Natronorubrum halalkaliphilum]MXV60565.1 MoaD family protein [Natronorubrum halalkaliphilum]
MHVTCTLYGPLRDAVGDKSLEREVPADATVGDVFDDLADDYPNVRELVFDGDDEFSGSISVMRNGRNVAFEDGTETPVADGDTLSASPPAEGG